MTTVVGGNCGFSIAPLRPGNQELIANTMEKVEDMNPAALLEGVPWDFETFPDYLASVERHGTVLNYGAYIGHTALRLYTMGDEAVGRPANADEIERMSAIIRDAMDAGAVGFATSFAATHLGADGQPIPSRWADRNELEGLFQAVADTGRGVIGVNGGSNLSLRDNYVLQQQIGIPFTYTAVLTQPNGGHLKALEINRQGWADGGEVWLQVTCRPLMFSLSMAEPFTFNPNRVFAELSGGSLEARKAAYADAGWRARVRDKWNDKRALRPRWSQISIMESVAHPELVGRRLAEIAEERGVDAFDALDGPHRGGAGAQASDQADHRQRRRGRALPPCCRTPTPRSACPTPAPTWVSSATRRCPPTCSATGSVTGACCRSRPRSASSPASRPTCSASSTAATSARATGPTWPCSTSPPSTPARCGGCGTSPPTPSASPPTPRPACATCWSTARPSSRTAPGSRTALVHRPGQVVAPRPAPGEEPLTSSPARG